MTRAQAGQAAVVALGCVVGAAALYFAATSDHNETAFERSAAGMLAGASFIVSGLVAAHRWPENRFGLIMAFAGFAWFVRDFEYANWALPRTIGLTFGGLAVAALVHALAIYPSGRFDSTLARIVAALAYLDAVGAQIVKQLFFDARGQGCTSCPPNPLAWWPNEDAVEVVGIIQGPIIGTALAILMIILLTTRWRRSTVLQRRALTPVLLSFTAFAVVFLAATTDDIGGYDARRTTALYVAAGLVFATIPLAFLAGLVRLRLSRAAVAALVVELSAEAPSPERLERSIGRALGDPSLELVYWHEDAAAYVDGDGRPVPLPANTGERAVRTIEADGSPVAALVFDPMLVDEPTLVEGVAAATRFALENERLRAELRAQLAETRASRARIVAAADAERRRLERNLHDGAQQRLLGLGIALRLLRQRVGDADGEVSTLLDEADGEVRSSIEELRELARGLHPSILTEQGLQPALSSLAQRAPLPVTLEASLSERLPAEAETAAYYVVSEAVANAAKHAQASGVQVEVRRNGTAAIVVVSDDGVGGADPEGTGLRGLADRVASIDGALSVQSPPGGGTRIEAVLPCGS